MNKHIELLTELGLFNNSGKIVSHLKRNIEKFNTINSYVIKYTDFLPTDSAFVERVYCLKQNIVDLPLCKVCGTVLKFTGSTTGYKNYCSVKCSVNSSEYIEKRTINCLEKHGVTHPAKTQQFQDKIKQTCLEKYGVEHATQALHVKEKAKQTNLERYGVENPLQSKEIQAKIKQTCLEKYGVSHHLQQHLVDNGTLLKLQNREYLIHQHHTLKKGLIEMAVELQTTDVLIKRYLISHDIDIMHYSIISLGEAQLYEYIKTIYSLPVVTNSRNIIPPFEIDVFLPDLNIGFEYDGLYWHSELVTIDNKYHLKKTNLCSNKNIKLIHIFENEWVHKQDIVKSRIKSILQLNKKVFARNCIIVPLTVQQQRVFINVNHIQAYVRSSICYGLLYNGEIVAAMSFSNPRYNIQYEYELLRYASRLNINVVGGAGKILSHFIKTHAPKSIISYADKRWSTGNLYKQLGFTHIGDSAPNYFYFKGNESLMSRIRFQKHKLRDKLERFDPELTEWQNMQLNGYNRIWDCGNSKWVLIL